MVILKIRAEFRFLVLFHGNVPCTTLFSQALFDYNTLVSGSICLKFSGRLPVPYSNPNWLFVWLFLVEGQNSDFFLYIFPVHINLFKTKVFFFLWTPKNKFGACWEHKDCFLKTWGKLNKKPIFENQTKFVKRKVECTVWKSLLIRTNFHMFSNFYKFARFMEFTKISCARKFVVLRRNFIFSVEWWTFFFFFRSKPTTLSTYFSPKVLLILLEFLTWAQFHLLLLFQRVALST